MGLVDFQIKRGSEANKPTLKDGEFYLVKDKDRLIIKNGAKEIVLANDDVVANINSQMTTISSTVASHTTSITALEIKVNGLPDDIGASIESLDTRVTTLENTSVDLTPITTRLTSVENQANTNKNNITSLTTRVSDNETNISNLDTRLSSLEDSGGVDLTPLENRVATLETASTSYNTKITSLEATTSQHTQNIETVNNNVETISGKVDKNTSDIATLQGKTSTAIYYSSVTGAPDTSSEAWAKLAINDYWFAKAE